MSERIISKDQCQAAARHYRIDAECYYRGYLCCIGNRVIDFGRGESWRGALIDMVTSIRMVEIRPETKAKAAAEVDALFLTMATEASVP